MLEFLLLEKPWPGHWPGGALEQKQSVKLQALQLESTDDGNRVASQLCAACLNRKQYPTPKKNMLAATLLACWNEDGLKGLSPSTT